MSLKTGASETTALPAVVARPAPAPTDDPRPAATQDAFRAEGYTVSHSETLGEIAKKFGISEAVLLEANPQIRIADGRKRKRADDGHWIYPGDVLRIPTASANPADPGATARRLRSLPKPEVPAPAVANQPVVNAGGPAVTPTAPTAAPVAAPTPTPVAVPTPTPQPALTQPPLAPLPAPVAVQPAAPPPPPTPSANGNTIVNVPVQRDGDGWKSPQSDGAYRSPGSYTGSGAPQVVQAGGGTYTPGVQLPPPPSAPYYPPPVYAPQPSSGGYQSPRSDGDYRGTSGYTSPRSDGGTATPSASGKSSKNEALIIGGIIAVAGLLTPALISTKTERAMGANAAKEALRKYPLYTRDPRLNDYVQSVMTKLAANRERKDINYEVRVVESAEPNAFALPGGYIYITTGALRMMKSESELAGVLGHEMTHIEKRHGIKAIQAQLVGMGIGVAALGQTDNQGIQVGGAIALGLALSGNSRAQESESDEHGCRFAHKAGYDPRGLTTFLEKIKRIEHPSTELLSDHPETDSRIKAVNKQIQKEGLLTGALDNGVDRFTQQTYWINHGY